MHHTHTIERLYRSHHQHTLRMLQRQFAGQPLMLDAAEDALADTWLILERKLRRDPDYINEATVPGWLYVVARREVLSYGRKRSRLVDKTDPDTALAMHPDHWSTEDTALADLELRELLDQLTGRDREYVLGEDVRGNACWLAKLTHQRRQALMTRLIGLSYRQATEATGKTYTAVNRGITEGRKALRS